MHEEVTVGQSMKLREDLQWGTPSMYEEVTVGQRMKLREDLVGHTINV